MKSIESSMQSFGEGQDDVGRGLRQGARAAKQFARQSSDAAAAAVKAGMESGKGAAKMAMGTAAAGPWGAALSAAWSMRHTLFKVIVVLGLVLAFLVVLITSLPSIVTGSVLGINGEPVEGMTLEESFSEMSEAVSDAVDQGYAQALARVEEIIDRGGYSYDLSMEAMVNHAQSSAGYDVCYILAAYSASLQQQNTTKADLVAKLQRVSGSMFPVSYEVREQEQLVPVTYMTYEQVIVTVVTARQPAGIVNGATHYYYIVEDRLYFTPAEEQSSTETITVPAYSPVTVAVPIYESGEIVGSRGQIFYEHIGVETLSPGTRIIHYAECTVHPFDNSMIAQAFDLDLDALYPQFQVTYGEAIDRMADALKRTLYGVYGSGQAVPLTDAERIAFVNRQQCNEARKHLLRTGLALVGKVPYFWGGKSEAGWNEEWNKPRLVTAAGSSTSGTIRPFGLDCSGFTDWTYRTALGVSLYLEPGTQWENCDSITAEELLPGDLGFLMDPDGQDWNHVLMFAGFSESGERMWVHSTAGEGVVLNSPSYEASLRLRRPKNADYDAPVGGSSLGEPLYALEVEVTHYCACTKCCGPDAQGLTASGKQVAQGMVAMSSYYPFGTQIMIDGVMYTVEDRGGSGIENDKSRVDIYVPDHEEALRLGRFTTTAYIYRIGR